MDDQQRRRPSCRPLYWILGAYLAITVSYGWLIPAWEANDELDHAANIEYILKEKRLVPLRFQTWHETHQPPLYYLLAAAWQRALGIPVFTPAEPTRTTGSMTGPNPQLAYVHNYTAEQRTAAIALHKLRLLSTLFGLLTVAFTYLAALEIIPRADVAGSAAAFVAFLPKFTVLSAALSNDSLLIALCSLALFLTLRCYRPNVAGFGISFLLGLTVGAAVITKLNSLPVGCFLIASLLLLPDRRWQIRARMFGAAILGGLASSAWWLLSNKFGGTGWLGQRGAHQWLNERLPGLVSVVPWTDQERFLNFVPAQLFQSIWYIGGWNQFELPFLLNLLLALIAAICCAATLRVFFLGENGIAKLDRRLMVLMGVCLMAILSVFIIARTTTQAQGRVAYAGLSAFAILAVIGATAIFPRHSRVAVLLWPGLLLLLNAYVFFRFVIPFAAL